MPRVEHVKARKDHPKFGIKKGDMHYVWSLKMGRGGQIFRQKDPPKPWQLTNSSFMQTLYRIEDALVNPGEIGVEFDLEGHLSDIAQQLEDLKGETEEKLENMPDGLREGDTGQMLQERVDNLDSWITELENADKPDRDNFKIGDEYDDQEAADEAYIEAIQEAINEAVSANPGF